MVIELCRGMTLHAGTLNAAIARKRVMVSAHNNADLQQFLFLYVCSTNSRTPEACNRTSKDFEVRRSFTAHQLTILREASHGVILREYDPTLFEGTENIILQMTGMLNEVDRESLAVLYAPTGDSSVSIPMHQADLIIGIASYDNITGRTLFPTSHPHRGSRPLPHSQRTREISGPGRSVVSVRQGMKSIADCWIRPAWAFKTGDQQFDAKQAEPAKKYSGEASVAGYDPPEVAIFSVLVEMLKYQDQIGSHTRDHVDS